MVQSNPIDPTTLPLPASLQNGGAAGADDHPVEFLSVIFNQREPNEVLRISKKAKTPMWLTKKLYQKLQTDVKFELTPIDNDELMRKYGLFDQRVTD